MNGKEFLVSKKLITQQQADAISAKAKAINDALAAYTAGKATMTKAQVAACLDIIVATKVNVVKIVKQ